MLERHASSSFAYRRPFDRQDRGRHLPVVHVSRPETRYTFGYRFEDKGRHPHVLEGVPQGSALVRIEDPQEVAVSGLRGDRIRSLVDGGAVPFAVSMPPVMRMQIR